MMKKTNQNLTKVSMFYNTEAIVIGGLCFVGYLGMTVYSLVSGSSFNFRTTFSVAVMTPLLFCFTLCYLRRRGIDSKGVFAAYLGIKYKRISWQNLHQYTVENIWPEYAKKRKSPDRCRAMLIFKAIPIEYGKSTTIMLPATKEARALAKKYFGPPAFVQEGINFEYDNK